MELDKNSWHTRLYFWSLEVWDQFSDGYTDRSRSNLCHYLRTIFVWMPLAICSNILVYALAFCAFDYFPLTRFGVWGTAQGYFWVAAILGGFLLFRFLKDIYDTRAMEAEARRPSKLTEDDEPPGFIRLCWEGLVAAKQKTCPPISFRDSQVNGEV